jgi:enoyl-CoA hydratase/carnithine racemase
MGANYEDIELDRDGDVAIVCFAAGQHNAVRARTLEELCDALDSLIDDIDVGAIVLAARGRHFVAGADLAWLDELRRMPTADVRDQIYAVFKGAAERLYRCPKPTVAAVQGAAVTVGCELALACDFRIAGERARFQESWIRLGLMPPLGGLFLLPRVVGVARASEMVLLGSPVDAEEALRIGLVNELLPEDQLRERAVELARELASMPVQAYRAVKEALHRGMEATMDDEWARNVATQSALIASDDFGVRLAAMREGLRGGATE